MWKQQFGPKSVVWTGARGPAWCAPTQHTTRPTCFSMSRPNISRLEAIIVRSARSSAQIPNHWRITNPDVLTKVQGLVYEFRHLLVTLDYLFLKRLKVITLIFFRSVFVVNFSSTYVFQLKQSPIHCKTENMQISWTGVNWRWIPAQGCGHAKNALTVTTGRMSWRSMLTPNTCRYPTVAVYA